MTMVYDDWRWALGPGDRLLVMFPPNDVQEAGTIVEDWLSDAIFIDYYAILCRRDRDGKAWWLPRGDLVSLISKAEGGAHDG
jgi:hypothetical protein